MKAQKTVILTDSKAALQSLTSNTLTSQSTNCWKTCSFSHKNAPWPYSEAQPTVGFQEKKEQIAWPSLEANNCNPCPPPLTRGPKPCSETVKNVNGEGPLETTTPLQTQSTVWQDMSRKLYSGCEQDTVACKRTWSELASRTLHSAIAKKQNRWSTTSSRTIPSSSNRDTNYGCRMSQPPTSCGEPQKTCATPPNSWQHVDWGSKHSWSTAEEEPQNT